jgi:alkylation response protein AidB-like acyl-CoA dehydrogenase
MIDDLDEQLAAVARTATQVAAASRGKGVRDVLRAFGNDGLLGAIASEDVGGLSLPVAFAAAIVAATAAEPLADPVLQALVCARFAATIDPGVATGVAGGSVLATLSMHDGLAGRARDGRISVRGGARNVVYGTEASYLLATVSIEGQPALALLELGASGVSRKEADTLDLDRSRAHLMFDDVAVAADRVLREHAMVQEFRDVCLILQSRWLQSAASACIRQTCEHVSTRRQFGQPMASMQAIRFALARCAVELENLRLLIGAAIDGFDWADRPAPEMAYAYAAEVCPVIVERCLQLHGAMGFTWDLPIHRVLRRIRAVTDDHTAVASRARVAALTLDAVAGVNSAGTG